MRTNLYKNKILNLLEKHHLLKISDMHKRIKVADYSTVYRNIEQLVREDRVRKVVLDKDTVLYEINKENNNHDHFLCLDCGYIEEIKISSESIPLLNKHKIKDLLVRGLCENCNS